MENSFLARVRSGLEQVFQSKEMDGAEFEAGEMTEEKTGSIWPLFAWILSTAVVTVLISLLFDAEVRGTAQIVGSIIIGAILLVPFARISRKKKGK